MKLPLKERMHTVLPKRVLHGGRAEINLMPCQGDANRSRSQEAAATPSTGPSDDAQENPDERPGSSHGQRRIAIAFQTCENESA